MAIKLFDTMTNQLQPLPSGQSTITMYTCGPTVYDNQHVGNWRTYIFYDTLRRVMLESGLKVNQVLNITDVGHLVSDEDEGEDKLVKAAKRERKTAWDIAANYTDSFIRDMERLNILKPSHLPKATDYIQAQIDLVKRLELKGVTYTIDDGVYFDTAKIDDYGKLAKLDAAALKAGARVEFNPQKRNRTDFALWKFSRPDAKRDMEWDSPWGKGFPGWHLECSAMALELLGPTIDIHAGGIDHIPVHHTNEIAQSETATGKKPFAKLWVHAEFLKINEQKIAKSTGNGVTIDDVIAKNFEPLALRLMLLQSHYKTEANFSWDNLSSATNRLLNLRQLAELRFQPFDFPSEDEQELLVRTVADMRRELQDNLNTPRALAILAQAADILQAGGLSKDGLVKFEALLKFVDDVLGLDLVAKTSDITADQKAMVAKRESARQAQDYASADQARDELAGQGIVLNDTPYGAIWHRDA